MPGCHTTPKPPLHELAPLHEPLHDHGVTVSLHDHGITTSLHEPAPPQELQLHVKM